MTWGRAYYEAMKAAEQLAKEGIEAEVIDPRTLRPLDHETIVAERQKTNRCVVVARALALRGPGAEIVDRVQREAFDYLDAPILRVSRSRRPHALRLATSKSGCWCAPKTS